MECYRTAAATVVADAPPRPALQQPVWTDMSRVQRVRAELSARPVLVDAADVRSLRCSLELVAAGGAHVIQAGDCAEDPRERTPADIARKVGVLELLAGTMMINTGKPVVRVGRIAGQFAKPRSNNFEHVDGVDMAVYRGHMVNTPEPIAERRQPDPYRMVDCYEAADEIMYQLGWRDRTDDWCANAPIWTSHEALVLDYEKPLLREDQFGRPLLGSTHWPWIGERTRAVEGAHVALLGDIVNPVACKVGPTASIEELLALCRRLDPEREPGRLTFVVRMGADVIAERLPPLVAAVRAAGHPIIWLSDPMHGNTVSLPDRGKTRYVEAIVREVQQFQRAVIAADGVAGGLHLETTPEDVVECVSDASNLDKAGRKYTSLCDPRLNPEQAAEVVAAWFG